MNACVMSVPATRGTSWRGRESTEDHFQVDENEVIQTPTGACWTTYPGRPEPQLSSAGMLGSLLPSGEDYRREDVERVAQLLAARPLHI